MGTLYEPKRLEAALAPLVGLPLWKTHRAADLQVFHFGDRRMTTIDFGPRKGQESEVGTYSLHIQCAWRVRGPNGIVVGSQDRFYKAGPAPHADEDDDWDWSVAGANRRDERLRMWLEGRSYVVQRANADATGGFVLTLAEGFALDLFPDDSLDDEYSEHWRILRPDDLESHFVVSGSGIED